VNCLENPQLSYLRLLHLSFEAHLVALIMHREAGATPPTSIQKHPLTTHFGFLLLPHWVNLLNIFKMTERNTKEIKNLFAFYKFLSCIYKYKNYKFKN
jgi:hypothetical protein